MQSMLKGIGAEYGDEVTKSNKKEDMMLGKRLRVLDRQERIAKSFRRKNLREVEKLKQSIHDMTSRSIDLKQYDLRRMSEKFGRHTQDTEPSTHKNTRNIRETKFNFRLPPLENNFMTGSPKSLRSNYPSTRISGTSTTQASGRHHRGTVTINGVKFDYGSQEHYKEYQRARKMRNTEPQKQLNPNVETNSITNENNLSETPDAKVALTDRNDAISLQS